MAVNVLENRRRMIAAQPHKETDSGGVVSFRADKALPLIRCAAQIEPVQDLNGYDSPWPAGGGKNKFDVDALSNTANITISNGNIIVKGVSKNSGKKLKEIADLVAGETYILTATTTGTSNFFYLYGSNNSWYFTNPRTVTQQDLDSTVFFYGIADASVSVTISNMMIRLASVTDATFVPYSNICPISGWTGAKVTRTGKNLLNEAVADISVSNAVWGGYPGPTFTGFLLKAGTYALSCSYNVDGFYVKDKDGTSIHVAYNRTSTTFTNPKTQKVSINFYINNVTQADMQSYDYQLELGSTATAYEPYQGSTYDITFPTEAGTVYGGTLDVVNGVLKVDRAMADLGALNWQYNSEAQIFFADPIPRKKWGFTNVICSAYKTRTDITGDNWNLLDKEVGGGINGYYIYIKDSSYSDTATFKAAMSGVQLVYELATPITYTLTPHEIKALIGANNVWADTGDVTVARWTH